ncbi:MAG: DNA repair protein RecN [Treponema sp.]|nr:MAG: DNA repair protein RecN [Treponema sp.]
MLESLSVKNIALIESLTVDFEAGFNVLSGETGAGKSIIIGALSILLGVKVSSDIIREGSSEGVVSGSFVISPKNQSALDWLFEHGVEVDEGRVLLRRLVKQNGRSSAWIQNVPVSRPELQEFTSHLVDLHGQHDHQSLFKINEHRKLLDCFAGIESEVQEYTACYNLLTSKRKEIESLNISEKERIERTDYLNYAIEEIDKANLKEGEDEELELEAKRLDDYEKLFASLQSADDMLVGENGGATSLMKRAVSELAFIKDSDKKLELLYDRLESAYYEIEDVAGELSSYLSRLTFDPERLDEIQERLAYISKLKKKYGSNIKDIFAYKQKAEQEFETLTKSETSKVELEKRISELEMEILKRGKNISQKRLDAALILQGKVEAVLKNLGMGKTKFAVQVKGKQIEDRKQTAGPYGFDNIEFLISPNLGEPLKPLVKIASGGELSRVMLALKTVLVTDNSASTLIFDEIDTGIGGEVALGVAGHMKKLSEKKQILCVTHLAVIASHADNQIKIEKRIDGNKTKTFALTVKDRIRVEEIARMLSGDEDSSASIAHAEELLAKYAQK